MPALPPSLLLTSVATPFGDVSVFTTEADGVVRVSGFGSAEKVFASHGGARVWGGWIAGQHRGAHDAVEAWADGQFEALDDVAVAQSGGPFMQKAWEQLRRVHAGEVVTYRELAERAGSPRASRAAGQACARNALAPFVPCHRVVAADGIGNYGYGVGLKARLLAHEGVSPDRLG